jgi:hypothetical protein
VTVHVFTGPTLSADEARGEIDAVMHPPAAQGDVYRAALERPAAIGIIDGYFEHVPSVSHKEILWAMSEGVHVFGSASIGALRAAELAPFGMEGVGAVFDAFARGDLEDDDEVAVAHATAEHGHRSLSEAMVNIRATIAAAVSGGVIEAAFGAAIEATAKALFYPYRCYPIVLTRAAEAGLDPAAIEALRGFLREGQVNRKREDARAMLRVMRERLAAGLSPKKVSYSFMRTDAWEFIRASAERQTDGVTTALPAALLEELRITGALPSAQRGAMARALAIEAAHRQSRTARGAVLQEALDGFRRDRGLLAPGDLQRWLEEQEIGDLERFMQDEAQVRWADALFASHASRSLGDHLRSTGEYGPLLARARAKASALEARGPGSSGEGEMTATELYRWYFEQRLGRPVPAHLAVYARSIGLDDEAALERMIRRELAYLRVREDSAAHGRETDLHDPAG